MKTNIRKVGDTTVVSMDGKLDFETSEPLKKDLQKLILNPAKGQPKGQAESQDSAPKKIIFNLENLEFVGSSGIAFFIQALKEFDSQADTKPRYCNVKSEFRRVMKAFDEEGIFEFYDNEEKARKSFDQ